MLETSTTQSLLLPTEKACKGCGETKALDEFHRFKSGLYGRNSLCKPCKAAYASRKRFEKHEESLAKEKLQRQSLDWAVKLLRSSRSSARQTNREHTLTVDDIRALHIQQRGLCYWLGIPLGDESLPNRHPLKPSLDRLDCSRGYTPDNVVLTTTFANLGRTDNSPEIMRQLVASLREAYNEAGGK